MADYQIERVALAAVVGVRTSELRPPRHAKDTISPGDLLMSAVHLAATIDGRIVGVASIVRERPAEHLSFTPLWRVRGVAVQQSHRGHGIGRELVIQCCRGADTDGSVWLYAQDRVCHFYQKLGFVRQSAAIKHKIAGDVGLFVLQNDASSDKTAAYRWRKA